MARTITSVSTLHGSKYLQQLCKHWSHRFEVTFDPQAGQIDFGDGQSVNLAAHPEQLEISITDTTGDRLERLETVVADHINRFAFRETLVYDWKRDI